MGTNRGLTRLGCLAVFVAFSSGEGQAEDGAPLSAIDWLSNSIEVPLDEPASDEDTPLATLPSDITVLPLDAPSPDTAGLRPASDLGLDKDIWGRSSAGDLAKALVELPDGSEAPPSVRRFLRGLLTLELEPPIDAAIDESFFLARVDRLLAMGHLEDAHKLLQRAGVADAERFRRAFDIALLRGSETEACRLIEQTPDLSPTYPARIFCLARLGQWDVAALTLGNAEALGILTPEEDQLLLHFLDPELFEDEPLPEAPIVPTPLLFRLYEAVGDRAPTDQLPVAFALADLGSTVGWKARLRATERLVAAEVLPFEDLIRVFTERKPAASGGIWERVSSIQALVATFEDNDQAGINARLSAAWVAAGQAGFNAAFADWVAPQLQDIDLQGPSKHIGFELALLSGRVDLAEKFAGPSAEDAFLVALASGRGGASAGASMLNQAVQRGLVAISAGATYEALIAADLRGEALFRALGSLKAGASGNPQATQDALALLRALGLEDFARQVAVELILMDGEA